MVLGREIPLPEDFCSASDDASASWSSPAKPVAPVPGAAVFRDFASDLPFGTGMGEDAAIWPVYNAETEKLDKDLVETYNASMESLLVFAALFSAVVTAFIIQSLPLLQQDNSQSTVDGLQAISAQLAGLARTDSNSTVLSAVYQPANFEQSSTAVAINLLWIISLFASLITAVRAMLVKQWLRAYISDLPAEPKRRAVERQRRYDGLRRFIVLDIADNLTGLLHAAVVVFLAGLVIYMWTQSVPIGGVLLTLLSLATLNYFVGAARPLVTPHCPYKSTATRLIRRYVDLTLMTAYYLRKGWQAVWPEKKTSPPSRSPPKDPRKPTFEDIRAEEKALSFLLESSSNPQARRAVMLASFSWQDQVTLSNTDLLAVSRLRAASLPLPNVFPPSVGAYDLATMPWADLKTMLVELAVVLSSYREVDPHSQQLNVDWAWPYPEKKIPKEDRFLYYALLCYCSVGGRSSATPYQVAWCDRAFVLLDDIGEGKVHMPLSTLGLAIFFRFLEKFGTVRHCRRLSTVLEGRLGNAVHVQTDVLCLSKLIWTSNIQSQPSSNTVTIQLWSATSRPFPNAMQGFFLPLIESNEHEGMPRAAMTLASRELDGNAASCFDSYIGLQAILGWFRCKGYLYPERTDRLETPTEILRQWPVEINLLNRCLRMRHTLQYLRPQDILDISQLIHHRSYRYVSYDWQAYTGDEMSGASELLLLCRSGRAQGDQQALFICTCHLRTILRGNTAILQSHFGNTQPASFSQLRRTHRSSFNLWLYWLTDPGMFQSLLEHTTSRRFMQEVLDRIVIDPERQAADALIGSNVMALVREWTSSAAESEDMFDEFKDLLRDYDAMYPASGADGRPTMLLSPEQTMVSLPDATASMNSDQRSLAVRVVDAFRHPLERRRRRTTRVELGMAGTAYNPPTSEAAAMEEEKPAEEGGGSRTPSDRA